MMSEHFDVRPKLSANSNRLTKFLNGEPFCPVTTEIFTKSECTDNCVGCIANPARKRGNEDTTGDLNTMPPDMLVQQIAASGVKGVICSGTGEPLLDPYFDQIIEANSNKNLDIGIHTNGQLLNEERVSNLADQLSNNSWIKISFSGLGNKELFLARHRPQKMYPYPYETRIHNIKCAAKAASRKYSIGIAYNITESTSTEDIETAVETAKMLGVDYLQFRPHLDNNLEVSPVIEKNIDALVKKYQNLELNSTTRVIINRTRYQNRGTSPKCSDGTCKAILFSTVISRNGEVLLCPTLACVGRNISIGNLHRQTLQKIFSSGEKIINLTKEVKCPPNCRFRELNKVIDNLQSEKTLSDKTAAVNVPFANFL